MYNNIDPDDKIDISGKNRPSAVVTICDRVLDLSTPQSEVPCPQHAVWPVP